MKSYWLRLRPFLFIFFVIETALRLSLLARGMLDTGITMTDTLQILLRGFWFDCVTVGFVLLPVAVALFFVSFGRRAELTIRFLVVFALLFGFVAEHIFWTEFTTRFNFIAADYLVYTQEVIGNIRESYPVGWIILGIAAVAALFSWYSLRRTQALPVSSFRWRAAGFAVYLALCAGFLAASDVSQLEFTENAEAQEIAANGVYNLFHAFWHNEISYEKFYVEHDNVKVQKEARTLLSEKNAPFENKKSLVRIVNPSGPELHKNVIIVCMESMSAEFMASFGNKQGITPNLDRLALQGLFFTRLYATGTRTVRGLEAVTLSVPPTPGQSIVRRPGNENLFSLGFVFKDRGYDTKFIYGGYGYFDNMNAFFAGNGFDVLDRTGFAKEDVHFANVWGLADDDVFARALKEADVSYAAHKPFMHVIMTTSNHRPYTYPDGHIDIPSKTGRMGGVKYADDSVGRLIAWAEKKPWFKDTVFVFVADHTAGASGKAELDPKKYHIPMILYAPGFIQPRRYSRVASQIDLAPILLGQLNFHYRTKFYGEDLLHDDDEIPHAFISNYQKVALVKEDTITVLAPKRFVHQYQWPDESIAASANERLLEDTVAYYQSASWWRNTHHRESTVIK